MIDTCEERCTVFEGIDLLGRDFEAHEMHRGRFIGGGSVEILIGLLDWVLDLALGLYMAP